MDVPRISLVIPCYNEASHLSDSVRKLLGVMENTRYEFEVVFVEDFSSDNTREILENICESDTRLRAIYHPVNRGRGAAFKTGYRDTKGLVCGFIDIDCEVHPLYIPHLVDQILTEDFDVVTGYRHYLLQQTGGLHRHILSWVYRRYCSVLLGLGIKDSETGCKFFKRETATETVLTSESDGWFWDTEVMCRAVLTGLKVKEVPVLFLRRLDKVSTVRIFRDTWDYLIALHRFRRRIGISILDKSPMYWTGAGYNFCMSLHFGLMRNDPRMQIAELIPEDSTVVDVCCGTCQLDSRFLQKKNADYLGLDPNGTLVMAGRKKGTPSRFFRLLEDELPSADYIIMIGSLASYHPREDEILESLKKAARNAVIISEPVRGSRIPFLGLARWIWRTINPFRGFLSSFRFSKATFKEFAERHGAIKVINEGSDRYATAIFETGPKSVSSASEKDHDESE